MNRKVDLTSNSRFSRNRSNDIRVFYDNFEFDEFFVRSAISVFHMALKIRHWTSLCLRRSDKILRKSGIGIFELNRSYCNPNADIPINDKYSCPRCGQNKAPWKEFCRRCESVDRYSYIIWNKWPNVREPKMESNKRILNL